ncbi:uncharacterized protein LOC131234468 [Magnolia sinica]|uniref:uncharacterized protein LOC131234468 n=1 Tax=Magnolia sinica TaxID=86752 RepID=UPI00265B250C|nr:uncharacterized protein LOC131234468 [Magnolia sinica]
MRSTVSVSDWRDSVVCPKPRRLGLLGHAINDPIRPLRWQLSHQTEQAGTELLDIILTKGSHGSDQMSSQVASSPPYFCGSPPSRAPNPLVHDARFGDEKLTPISSPLPIPSGLSSSPSTASSRKGCVRTKFGHAPAAVRIEGFDCLDRDRRSCRISAVA